MLKKDKQTNTALIISKPSENIPLPAGLLKDEDFATQQQEEAPIFPYISIRQKDPRDDTKIEWRKGWWKISNAPEAINDTEFIRGVVLFWSRVRTYFREGDEVPYCKSIDGVFGSLINDDTGKGQCPNCRYSKWTDKSPVCAEGRNLYCFLENIGGCIVRLGRSGIKPWRAFDNLMRAKTVTAPNGETVRIPWHLNIIEMRTEKITKPSFDPYWVPVISHVEIIKDVVTINMLRELIKRKEQYDKTAEAVDLGSEDVTGYQNGERPEDSNDLPF